MRTRSASLAVTALGAALACGALFCGGQAFEVAGDGGTGGGSGGASGGGPVPDGAPLPHDAAASDGNVVANDGATPLDGAAPDAGGAFSCANAPPSAIFCADFDGVSSPQQGWTNQSNSGGGTNALDTVHYLSSPAAYVATTGLAAAGHQTAYLFDALTSAAGNVDYAFSIYATTLDFTGGGAATIARVAVGPSSARTMLADVTVDSNGLHLVQAVPQSDGGAQTQSSLLDGPVALTTWKRLRVVLDRTTNRVRVVLDETKTFSVQALGDISSSQLEIDLGVVALTPPSQGVNVTFDNVLAQGL
jgi:hypothetical protein